MNNLYGINAKLIAVGTSRINLPESKLSWAYSSELGNMDEYFDDAYTEGNTYFIGFDPDHNDVLSRQIYADEIFKNYNSSNVLLSGSEEEVLENLKIALFFNLSFHYL